MTSSVEHRFVVIYATIVSNSAKKKRSNVRPTIDRNCRLDLVRRVEIVKKYSNFVAAPIYINDVRVNNLRVSLRNTADRVRRCIRWLQALWMEDGKSIKEDEHTEFYRFITGQYDKPRYTLQYKIDVPINVRALIYIPQYKPSQFSGKLVHYLTNDSRLLRG